MAIGKNRARRRWLALGARIARLFCQRRQRTADLVRASYDRIAAGYDDAWTHHMRDLTLTMLDQLAPLPGADCLDLTCGTGFATGELVRRGARRVVGVDASIAMLEVARTEYGARCNFIQADIVDYLRSCPRDSIDVVTCAWGLGYARPLTVLREVARVLHPGGRVGIIDNTLFSLAEVLWTSILAFAERPEMLRHVMQVRFLPGPSALAAMMRLHGLAVIRTSAGSKTYHVADGRAAINRLVATGAAAGFEFATDEQHREAIFGRFAELLERRCMTGRGLPITHRYLAAIGERR